LIQYFLVNLFVINTTIELQYKTKAEKVQAHTASLISFYSIYPTTQRQTILSPNNNYSITILSDTIIATTYNIDNKSSFTTNNNNFNTTEHIYHHLQNYLNNIISKTHLKDGIEDFKLNSIVAV
jgi:hypothetical protein